jgi:ribosomal protein S12 methylthiotransferase
MRFSVLTLGCDKKTVDSERYRAELVAHGADDTADPADADVIIINTCGFIDAAKRESIDTILEAARLKDEGKAQAVFAVGCMVERHKGELAEAIPEVDAWLGTSEADQLVPSLVERGLLGGSLVEHPGVRLFGGEQPAIRYLKVSEGCDHGCAFCAIPLMRGKHRSFALDDIVREAQLLELQGARELNLVAQDLAHYGRDRRDGTALPELLEALVRDTTVPWIRMLYLYSAGISRRLLDVIAANPRIVQYLDMPMQHGHDAVLARMRRPERARTIREKVALYREVVPDLAIRTTVIVGFPGETDEEFNALCELLEEIRFDRVGVFTYSAQEGTRAAQLDDDVPDSVKRERQERVIELQRAMTAERYERFLGREARVLLQRIDADGVLEARAPWQADDVDGVVHCTVSPAVAATLTIGSLLEVSIDDVVDDYDFSATFRRVADAVPVRAATPSSAGGRNLPLVGTAPSSVGSFGR